MEKHFIKERFNKEVKKYCVCYWGNLGGVWGLATVTVKEFDTKKEAENFLKLKNGANK